jgi:hypothetical protein
MVRSGRTRWAGRLEMYTKLKKADHLEDLGVDRTRRLKGILNKDGEILCTGFNWLKIVISGWPL